MENGDSAMKRGLKELAKEVGVTPSYLCRVFKRTMGVTIGVYMKEFERDPGEGKMESSVQTPSTMRLGTVGVETGLLTPATTIRSLSVPVEGGREGSVEEDVGSNAEEALDLDLDFNEWFWNEDYLDDSIYRSVI